MSPEKNTVSVQHNVQVDMCIQLRFKPVYASAQSDQSHSVPPEELLNPWLPIERTLKILTSLRGCAGWSESSMGAHANLYLLLHTDSVIRQQNDYNQYILPRAHHL